MKLTIEFDSEWWRVRVWWRRKLCRLFGHPGRKPPQTPLFSGFWMGSFTDKRIRCVRCGAPHPDEPEPAPLVYTWSDKDLSPWNR